MKHRISQRQLKELKIQEKELEEAKAELDVSLDAYMKVRAAYDAQEAQYKAARTKVYG